jgi:hypothetical protein
MIFSKRSTEMRRISVLALAVFALVAFCGVTNAAPKAKVPVTFTFDFADYVAKDTDFYLVGDFQGWSTKVPKYKMVKKEGTVYSVTVDVKQGAHTYKYWAAGSGWIIKDMGAVKDKIKSPAFESAVGDGFDGKNAVLTVK